MEANSNTQVGSLSLTFKAVDKLFIAYNVVVLGLILLFGVGRADFKLLIGWHLSLIGLVLVLAVYETMLGQDLFEFSPLHLSRNPAAFCSLRVGPIEPARDGGLS